METRATTPDRADATRRHERALLAYLRATDESVEPLDALLADHPTYAPAHLLVVGKAVAAKDARALGTLERALAAIDALSIALTAAERASLAAARAWLAREPARAARLYSEIALEHPDDVLSLRLAQSCWYFLGSRNCVRVVAERVAARAPADAPGYDCALAMEAFGCAETGDGERAQALAQRALEIAPASPYALHALAHALVTQRRGADARALLESTAPAWRRRGRMASHNAWHLALLRLESGDGEAALAAVERELVPAAAAEPGAVADATDLLWRLELRGADTARAWRRLAASWAERHVAGFWGFLDVLAGVAFERAGDVRRARSLARNVARAAAAARSPEERAAQLTTGDALAALAAYTVEDFGRASALLREVLPRLGGSVPQRELLGLTLAAAERRHAEIALDAAVAA